LSNNRDVIEMAEPITLERQRERIKDIRKMVELAVEQLPKEIERCDFFRTSFWLGDAGEAYGSTIEILNQYPEDSVIKKEAKEIFALHDKAFRLRDDFNFKCSCKKKELEKVI
jgi:hypothetical protein